MRVTSPEAFCVAFALSVYPTHVAFAPELTIDPKESLPPPQIDFKKPGIAMTEFEQQCVLPLPPPEDEGLACVDFEDISPGPAVRDIIVPEGTTIGQPPISVSVIKRDDQYEGSIVIDDIAWPQRITNFAMLDNTAVDVVFGVGLDLHPSNQVVIVYLSDDSTVGGHDLIVDGPSTGPIQIFENEKFAHKTVGSLSTQVRKVINKCPEDELIVTLDGPAFYPSLTVTVGPLLDGKLVLGMVCVGHNVREVHG
jgi:hypothetical protein